MADVAFFSYYERIINEFFTYRHQTTKTKMVVDPITGEQYERNLGTTENNETYRITNLYEWTDAIPTRLADLYDYENPPENMDGLQPKYTSKSRLGTNLLLSGDVANASDAILKAQLAEITGQLKAPLSSFMHGFQYRNLDNLSMGIYGYYNDPEDWGYSDEHSTAFIAGNLTADVLDAIAGAGEIALGASAETFGIGLSGTGAGIVVGAPLAVAGAAVATYGAGTIGTSLKNLGSDAKDLYNNIKSGEGTGTHNLDKVDDKYLKQKGIDAHQLKKDVYGKKSKVAEYDIYVDKNTGELYTQRKPQYNKSGEPPVPTGEYIK